MQPQMMAQPMAQPMMQPQMQVMSVQVPQGMQGGQMLQVQTWPADASPNPPASRLAGLSDAGADAAAAADGPTDGLAVMQQPQMMMVPQVSSTQERHAYAR